MVTAWCPPPCTLVAGLVGIGIHLCKYLSQWLSMLQKCSGQKPPVSLNGPIAQAQTSCVVAQIFHVPDDAHCGSPLSLNKVSFPASLASISPPCSAEVSVPT